MEIAKHDKPWDKYRDIGVRASNVTAMNLRRLSILYPIFVVIGASSAVADDVTVPFPPKAPPHVTKAKHKSATSPAAAAKPSKLAITPGPKGAPAAFSDPRPPPAPETKGALANPKDNLSFGLKWHATSDPYNPYEAVQHTASPYGPGAAVEAGVKIPFFGF